METTYKIVNSDITNEAVEVIRTDDRGIWTVPIDIEENKDCQEYLAWVAEGNTPEPADE